MPPKPAPRNNYLDWLRVLAILFVFVYHSTRFYNTEDWHIKNPTLYPAVDIWNLFAWNWMMPLILVISGASLFYAVGKASHGKFVKDKVLRLLVPFAFGLFTHASFQKYLEWTTHGQFTGSFFEFLPVYYRGAFAAGGPIGGLFELNSGHLWYLWWLFVFTLLAYPLMLWLKRGGQRVLASISSFLARPGAVYLLALPSILLMAFADPNGPLMSEKEGGWALTIYFWLLLCGFVLISSPRIGESIQRLRWISLVLGAVILSGVGIYALINGVPVYGQPIYALAMGAAGFSSWCWILAWYGLAMRYLDFRTPRLEYANEAVLPFYILHQTVLLCVGYFVVQWPFNDFVEWAFILVVSFAIIIGLYEYLIRRYNFLRFLFGMKVIPSPKEAPAAESPAAA